MHKISAHIVNSQNIWKQCIFFICVALYYTVYSISVVCLMRWIWFSVCLFFIAYGFLQPAQAELFARQQEMLRKQNLARYWIITGVCSVVANNAPFNSARLNGCTGLKCPIYPSFPKISTSQLLWLLVIIENLQQYNSLLEHHDKHRFINLTEVMWRIKMRKLAPKRLFISPGTINKKIFLYSLDLFQKVHKMFHTFKKVTLIKNHKTDHFDADEHIA